MSNIYAQPAPPDGYDRWLGEADYLLPVARDFSRRAIFVYTVLLPCCYGVAPFPPGLKTGEDSPLPRMTTSVV
jgi:hypothetical protein